ncbi:MAG: biotin/lipoyl-containing protein [Anaerolineaceae bacterium]
MKIHVKIQNSTYEVVIGDIHARPIQASVDGDTFEVWPEETILPAASQAVPVETTSVVKQVQIEAPSSKPGTMSSEISAPIPGVIIDILIKAGDKVKYGQELCILEAMKMKNSIRASRDGVIDEILVSSGDQVKHGQILIRFKD